MLKKKFIFGLGNPGVEYHLSRHNTGFMFLDYLQQQLELPNFTFNHKFSSEISVDTQFILAKPQTFMNLSGQAVSKIIKYLGNTDLKELSHEDLDKIFVVHDDLDLPIGEFKIQQGVGPKQHNGLLSIYQELGLENFWHIRIGVDDRKGDRSFPAESYVLQKLPQEQLQQLQELFLVIMQQLKFA